MVAEVVDKEKVVIRHGVFWYDNSCNWTYENSLAVWVSIPCSLCTTMGPSDRYHPHCRMSFLPSLDPSLSGVWGWCRNYGLSIPRHHLSGKPHRQVWTRSAPSANKDNSLPSKHSHKNSSQSNCPFPSPVVPSLGYSSPYYSPNYVYNHGHRSNQVTILSFNHLTPTLSQIMAKCQSTTFAPDGLV